MEKKISAAAVRRVWLDPNLTVAEAGAAVGLVRSAIWRRAKALGLPPKREGRREKDYDLERFALLYRAGVRMTEIGAEIGASTNKCTALARALRLKPRGNGRMIGLAEAASVILRLRMEDQVRADRAAARSRGLDRGDPAPVVKNSRSGSSSPAAGAQGAAGEMVRPILPVGPGRRRVSGEARAAFFEGECDAQAGRISG